MNSTPPQIYVAGHRGMVGSAIVRQLLAAGHPASHIVTRTHAELDLTNQAAVREFFAQEKPDQVYLAAAKVGGIHANNTYPAEFIYQNLMMQANVIEAAFQIGVKKLLFLGSSCIYPKLAAQPMTEDALLTGTLEPTNEPYAIAKIAGIKLCESYNRQYGASHGVDYRSVMPMRQFMLDLGVPANALLTEERSRNTRENAEMSAKLLRERGIQKVLLVTSALHMRRAVKLFEQQGLLVQPVATDHEVGSPKERMSWLPDANALDVVLQ
jgi:uncharacterized SAM-binding protein YcdF (DUF218 family)